MTRSFTSCRVVLAWPSRTQKVKTSICFGTFGQCFFKTFKAYGMISICPTHLNPAFSSPISNPPAPENTLRKFMIYNPCPRQHSAGLVNYFGLVCAKFHKTILVFPERVFHNPYSNQSKLNRDLTSWRLRLRCQNPRRGPRQHPA